MTIGISISEIGSSSFTMVRSSNPDESFHLSASDVHVWHASLLLSDSLLARLRGSLAPEERARADRFAVDTARVRFVASRGILRAVLSRYVNEPPGALTFIVGPHGKPALAGPGNAGDRIRFNLSHSSSSVLIAVSSRRDVGVDLEQIRADVEIFGIAEQFFAPSEFERLRRLPSPEAHRLFFTLWTSKVAYLKATGTGLSLEPDRFEVRLAQDETMARVKLLAEGRDHESCLIRILSVEPGYVGAVAAEGDDWRVIYRRWSDLPES
jgi:4'-phosphopantetheinyl transferase